MMPVYLGSRIQSKLYKLKLALSTTNTLQLSRVTDLQVTHPHKFPLFECGKENVSHLTCTKHRHHHHFIKTLIED